VTARSATAWIVRTGFWVGVVLAITGPVRAVVDYLTAPAVLLSLRDAGRVAGASRTVDQSVVSIDDEPKAAIRVRPPARIEWPLRLRPGGHRIDAAVEALAKSTEAFAAAREEAGENDKIVAFGSFLTVAEVMQSLAATRNGAGTHG